MITVKDFVKSDKFPYATKDATGRLVVGRGSGRRRGRRSSAA